MDKGIDATVAAAVLAGLGYVAKQFIDLVNARLAIRRARKANLLKLHALLRAGRVIFEVQNRLVRELVDQLARNHPELVQGDSFEDILVSARSKYTAAEAQQHSVIRGQTTHALHNINTEISQWLSDDQYFKTYTEGSRLFRRPKFKQLAYMLAILEAHLRLWHAKYEAWIPEHPEHALVYLDDEARHGVGFPIGLDDLVAELASAPAYSPGNRSEP
jgi:hypothetical protein